MSTTTARQRLIDEIRVYCRTPSEANARHLNSAIEAVCGELERLQAPHGEPVAIELLGVREALAEGRGFWAPCSGCHELNEGQATGTFSPVLNCQIGNGCSECGGIGAVWDDTDYDAMARDMMKADAAPKPVAQLTDEELADCGLLSELADEEDAAPQPAAAQGEPSDEAIRRVFIDNGFTIKPGSDDLKPYVYAAARAVLALRSAAQPAAAPGGWSPPSECDSPRMCTAGKACAGRYGTKKICSQPAAASQATKADPLTQAIQRLNSTPYSLTKDECIQVLRELRDEIGDKA